MYLIKQDIWYDGNLLPANSESKLEKLSGDELKKLIKADTIQKKQEVKPKKAEPFKDK